MRDRDPVAGSRQDARDGTKDRVCATETVFHYFLHGEPDLGRLATEGLVARPAERAEERQRQREVYAELFEPRLGRAFTTAGVFFTPIDFWMLPGSLLATRPRIALAIASLDPASSVLTWELEGRRTRLPATAAALRRAAGIWTAGMVREWFGRDRQRLFWHVPQVGCFEPQPIHVGAPQHPARSSQDPSVTGERP